MQLDYLLNYEQHIPTIATWFHRQWNHLNPNRTKAQVIDMIYTHLNTDKLPIIYVAIENSLPIGAVMLRISDMEGYPQFSPWLSSLFIAPEHRNRGYGKILMRHCLEAAKNMKFTKIYLNTEDQESWYTPMGWQSVVTVDYRGFPTTIMKKDLI